MKRAPTDRFVRACVLATPLSLFACGPPVLYDTDLEPVRNPLIVASVENGWMAVDSSAAGIRAVLELQVEASPLASEYVSLHVPELHCSSSGVHRPVKVRREAPTCAAPPPTEALCSPTERESGDCPPVFTRAAESCMYVVRAEYLFDQVPHLDESHYFTFAQTETPVYWTRDR